MVVNTTISLQIILLILSLLWLLQGVVVAKRKTFSQDNLHWTYYRKSTSSFRERWWIPLHFYDAKRKSWAFSSPTRS